MNAFLIAWLIAGFVLGWIAIDIFVIALLRVRNTPTFWLIAFGFVGALIAYTILR